MRKLAPAMLPARLDPRVVNVPLGPEGRATVTFNGSGNGTAQVGPLTARETWHPDNCHVNASSAVNEAVCVIYAGDRAIPANQRDTTFTGSSGDATDKVSSDVLKCGQRIFAAWTGGDPGATGYMTVTGTRDI